MKKFISQCIGFLLVIIAIQIYSAFSKNTVTKEDINQYISQSEIIFVNDIKFIGKSNFTTYKNVWRGLNPKPYHKESHLAYSPTLNKYFSLENYDYSRTDFPSNNSEIYLMVNKIDMQNQLYGTLQAPIPVLFFYTNPKWKNDYIHEPYEHLSKDDAFTVIKKTDPRYRVIIQKFNKVPNNLQYIKNVHEYLAYKKEEF